MVELVRVVLNGLCSAFPLLCLMNILEQTQKQRGEEQKRSTRIICFEEQINHDWTFT